jgi:hypothetical protein
LVFETVGQRDRKSFHFKPEPSREPQILRARILGRDKMNISEYPFSTFIGIDISKDKIDIAELKGAAGKTIGNNKKEICRWIKSLKETGAISPVLSLQWHFCRLRD